MFAPSKAQKIGFFLFDKFLSPSFYLKLTKEKYNLNLKKRPSYLERHFQMRLINRKVPQSLKWTKPPGEILAENPILEFEYVLLPQTTLPVLVSFSSMRRRDIKHVAKQCCSREILHDPFF